MIAVAAAAAAAFMFVLGVIVPDGVDSHGYVFWMLLGFMCAAIAAAAHLARVHGKNVP